MFLDYSLVGLTNEILYVLMIYLIVLNVMVDPESILGRLGTRQERTGMLAQSHTHTHKELKGDWRTEGMHFCSFLIFLKLYF